MKNMNNSGDPSMVRTTTNNNHNNNVMSNSHSGATINHNTNIVVVHDDEDEHRIHLQMNHDEDDYSDDESKGLINKSEHSKSITTEVKSIILSGGSIFEIFGKSKMGLFVLGIAKWGIRIVGYFMITLALTLLALNAAFYFFVALPMMAAPGSLLYLFGLLLGFFMGFNLFFNYYKAVSTSPGDVPQEWLAEQMKSAEELKRYSSITVKGESFSKYCNRCEQPKPPRAHHCHICDKCICRMDHHCPWINNCVGYKNHRYFFLFIFYLWISAIYYTILLVLLSWQFIAIANPALYDEWKSWFVIIEAFSGSVSVSMTGLFIWNLYLIATNQTTVEFHFNKLRSTTDKGSGKVSLNEFDVGIRNNFDQIFGFGNSSLLWILLPSVKPLPLNGATYPTLSTLNYEYRNDEKV
jgi:palmitoyltransferase